MELIRFSRWLAFGRVAGLAIAASLSSPSLVRADDAGDARAVVQSQIDALERNDAEAAYAFASPMVRDMFPSADIFIGMVRNAYTPVYRHKRFEMGETTTDTDGRIMLRAGIVDDDDVAWEALYTLERQGDGSIKIAGCVLRKIGTAV